MEKVDWFLIYLRDYEATVKEILPRCLASNDEGLVDDLHHALDLRSQLERALAGRPERVQQRAVLARWDQELAVRREALAGAVRDWTRFRGASPPPRSHWWWYLDEGTEPAAESVKAAAAAASGS
jgi:hypothetical protein